MKNLCFHNRWDFSLRLSTDSQAHNDIFFFIDEEVTHTNSIYQHTFI